MNPAMMSQKQSCGVHLLPASVALELCFIKKELDTYRRMPNLHVDKKGQFSNYHLPLHKCQVYLLCYHTSGQSHRWEKRSCVKNSAHYQSIDLTWVHSARFNIMYKASLSELLEATLTLSLPAQVPATSLAHISSTHSFSLSLCSTVSVAREKNTQERATKQLRSYHSLQSLSLLCSTNFM